MFAFLNQVARFGLIGLLFAGAILVTHSYFYFYLCEKGLKMPQDVDTLVLGHSHAERGVNPALFPGCKNVAQSNEGYDINALKLRLFLKRNPGHIKRVILSVAYHSFWGLSKGGETSGEAITDAAWDSEKKRRYAYLNYSETLRKPGWNWRLLRQNWLLPTKGTLRTMIKYLVGDRYWTDGLPFMGGYQRSYSSMLTPQMLEASLVLYSSPSHHVLNYASLEHVQSIMDECARNNVVAELVFFPVHPDYQAGIPVEYEKDLKKTLGKMAEKQGGKLHDFTSFKVWSEQFQDHTHLNAFGSDTFTPFLTRAIGHD